MIQIGVDENQQPVYEECGALNLYKTDTTGGREWRLENTCNQLIDVMLPTVTPTPGPGVTPTPGGGGPTPTPPRSTVSGDCPDGFLAKVNTAQWSLTNAILQEGRDYTYCVDLPVSTRPFFEVKTVNKGNSSCSDLAMTVISPLGAEYKSFGSQPGTVALHSAGRWRLRLHLNWGCNRYDVNFAF